jgi:hypothetical protein
MRTSYFEWAAVIASARAEGHRVRGALRVNAVVNVRPVSHT